MNHHINNRAYRELIVSAYSHFIREKIDDGGLQPYFLNLMFNHIPGGPTARQSEMISQVDRVHSILTRHMVRMTDAENWRHLRPIFIGCIDMPVWKHKKVSVRSLVVNDGMHFNAVALVPPPTFLDLPIKHQFLLWGRQSRLKVRLDQHFRENERFYRNDVLDRIHVTPITEGTMADYALKAFKHGRIAADSVRIWN